MLPGVPDSTEDDYVMSDGDGIAAMMMPGVLDRRECPDGISPPVCSIPIPHFA